MCVFVDEDVEAVGVVDIAVSLELGFVWESVAFVVAGHRVCARPGKCRSGHCFERTPIGRR